MSYLFPAVRKESHTQAPPDHGLQHIGTLQSGGSNSASWMAVSIPAMYDPELRQLVFSSRTKVDAQHLLPLEQVRVIRKNAGKVGHLEIVGHEDEPYRIEVAKDTLDTWYKMLQKERVEAMRAMEERLRAADPYYEMRHKMKGRGATPVAAARASGDLGVSEGAQRARSSLTVNDNRKRSASVSRKDL